MADGYGADSLRSEVGRLRARDVDRYVTQRIDHRQGDVTTEQVEAWEREGYRRWRENWPALNSLLIPHGSLGEPDGGSAASCGCGNDAAHAPRTTPSAAGTP